tara:strand:- start:1074 stop:2327 length:1254 start_codon:yes stop_codon:yes gene_type:complete
MISIKKLRTETQYCQERLSLKQQSIKLNSIIELDQKLRQLKTSSSDMRAKRNAESEKIGHFKRDGLETKKSIENMRILGSKLKALEAELSEVSDMLRNKLYQLPNIPHETVPKGLESNENKVVRYWGEKPKFNFTPLSHLEIGDKLNLFDFKRSAKLSGSGFPLYRGFGAKLERELINSMMNYHRDKYNFEEIFPPVLMRKKSMLTTGQLPKFEDDMYHTETDNLYLAPTAEVPITNLHRDEILDESELPIYYVAYSPCFRRESGSYGKDTRGLLRVHQFNKVELVKFVVPDTSYDELESLTMQAESILQNLGLHYRIVELCIGDLGFAASKCYDIEVWAPGECKWLEASSCSNFESFQARRGNIRFRNANNDVKYLHTLNGSGLATPRLMIALLETYQTEDGSVEFPESVSKFLSV